MKVQPIYNSKILKKGLEFASNNGALFVATTSLLLSTVARPIAIMATPKTDRQNKEYAASKSLASSAVGYLMMLACSLPLANAVKKIDENPKKYLKENTIAVLKEGANPLVKSSKYKFATQLFKLGLGFLIAVPKSVLTCSLIPLLKKNVFDKEKENNNANISFKGLEKPVSSALNSSIVQRFSEKFHKTNFEQHIISLTDALSTSAFIWQTSKSKQIEKDRKKALMYNSAISTGLCISGGYTINSLTKKSTDMFIKNFKNANKNSPKLDKYIEGIKIAKPAIILGGLYYIAIPLISTFIADRCDKKNKQY